MPRSLGALEIEVEVVEDSVGVSTSGVGEEVVSSATARAAGLGDGSKIWEVVGI